MTSYTTTALGRTTLVESSSVSGEINSFRGIINNYNDENPNALKTMAEYQTEGVLAEPITNRIFNVGDNKVYQIVSLDDVFIGIVKPASVGDKPEIFVDLSKLQNGEKIEKIITEKFANIATITTNHCLTASGFAEIKFGLPDEAGYSLTGTACDATSTDKMFSIKFYDMPTRL